MIYLVQHAEAKSEEEDIQRPITSKGREDAKKTAEAIKGIKLDLIMHSGKNRARQTAEVMAKILNPTEGIKEAKDLEPLADAGEWASRLAEMKKEVMLVGHLPHLSNLVSLMLCGDEEKKVINFKKAGIICLGIDEAGEWTIEWIITPEVIKK
jgi:phosphohistidine phosphatase